MSSPPSTLMVDVGAWFTNVASSVLIIFVNKLLMGTQGFNFRFAVTLSGMHYLAAATLMQGYKATGYMTVTKPMPWKDLLLYVVVGSTSIVSLNVSLMLNSVGFYQICKLIVIPFVCLCEYILYSRTFSPKIISSIAVVIFGVAIVTVSNVQVNMSGLLVALLSIVAAGSQQVLCGHLQRSLSMSATEMLLYTAWPMGFSLVGFGPFLDYFVTGGSWVFNYPFIYAVNVTILATCALAVGVNVSQFACLGRFSAVAYQVMGHTKTMCVLLGGAIFFGDIITVRVGTGMALAVVGMISYGVVSQQEKPKVIATPETEPLTGSTDSSGAKRRPLTSSRA